MADNAKMQDLQQENRDLQKALQAIEAQLDATLAEKDQIGQLYDEFRAHFDQMNSQKQDYQKRLGEEIQSKKDLEVNLEGRLQDMRRLVDMKQREMDQMAQKLSLPIDTDILRMKIQKDLEARHRIDLEQKQNENERLSDQFYESKRQLDILRTQFDSQKYEHEKELQDIKDKFKGEIQELFLENQTLQQRADDKRDRDLIRQLRRDLDESKRRAQDILQEANQIRRERDTLKLEKNEQFLENQREREEQKNKTREIQTEHDRIEFKSKSLIEENQKMHLKMEKKSNEVHQALAEKVQLENIVKSKDQMIDTLNRQINQLREDLKSKDLEQETIIRRKHEEDRQRELQDKNENIKLQHDVEYVKKQKLELEGQLRTEIQKWRGDAEAAERKLRSSQDELKQAQHKLKELKNEHDNIQRNNILKSSHINQVDGDYNTIQEKYQKLENDLQMMTKVKNQLEENVKTHNMEMQKFQFEYEDQLAIWKKEKSEMQSRIHELMAVSDKIRYDSQEQIETFKQKYNDYKTKLKKANASISTLTSRIAKYELQMAAEREIGRVDGGGAMRVGSDLSNPIRGHGVLNHHYIKSSDGDLSPMIQQNYGEFNVASYSNDLENKELNEEIKKLLMENQF